MGEVADGEGVGEIKGVALAVADVVEQPAELPATASSALVSTPNRRSPRIARIMN
jgi:hypothetical protein